MLKHKIVLASVLLACSLGSMAQNNIQSKNINGSIFLPSRNITDNLAAAPDFSAFYNLLKASGTINTPAPPVTFLVPGNKAFAKLAPGELDTLVKPENTTALVAMINKHILPGKLTAASIAQLIKQNNGSTVLTTAAGTTITAKIDANRNIILTDADGGTSVISRFDIAVQNGLMHVVTEVL
ncbi:hypothetical protein DJ568_08710 [Mucilaginibacter hurinus]|uniref:FAS1 domain-containing protein n=1 Tax=Mucilaginibacter hurinus TaxID=2201324 RepID=A0A367GQW3_9SPHI|nr:fasciclin domain-containing protein [Mucilaginibacter hurinus]RCH55256.1 hypothetical protein DJ568_08710 [Mucilaginibacter hurinus]